jgi:hypothetical protein
MDLRWQCRDERLFRLDAIVLFLIRSVFSSLEGFSGSVVVRGAMRVSVLEPLPLFSFQTVKVLMEKTAGR